MVLQQSQKEANLVAEIPEKRVQHMLFLEIVMEGGGIPRHSQIFQEILLKGLFGIEGDEDSLWESL